MKHDVLTFDVTIRGLVPLLMSRFPEEEWESGQPVSLKNAPKPTKQQMYEKSLYKTEDGKLYQPASHIVGAMIKAASRVILKGRTSYLEIVEGGVFVYPEQVIHKIQKPEIDWRPIVNWNTRPPSRNMSARGRLENWELDFQLACWDDRAEEAQIKQVLEIGGLYIGLGSYRPRYGRFEIVSWKKSKPVKK